MSRFVRIALPASLIVAAAACAPLSPLGEAPAPQPAPGAQTDGRDPAAMAFLRGQSTDETLSRGERVELQQGLYSLGYDLGAIDGVIGRRSRDAIRSYQASADLPVNGLYSRALLGMVQDSVTRLAASGGARTAPAPVTVSRPAPATTTTSRPATPAPVASSTPEPTNPVPTETSSAGSGTNLTTSSGGVVRSGAVNPVGTGAGGAGGLGAGAGGW